MPEGKSRMKKTGKSERIYIDINDDAPAMEAYRMLKTNIEFSNSVNPIKKILITSSVAGEGKSTTVYNLAKVFALGGDKTLIIDLDLRRPVIHRIIGEKPEHGITSLIIGKKTAEEIITPTKTDNLYFISCGERPVNPAEMLSSNALAEAVEELCGKFDIILLDSPPSAALADAAIISRFADTVLLVVSAGQTSYADVENSLDNLKKANARVAGVIMNNVTKKSRGYKYCNYDY